MIIQWLREKLADANGHFDEGESLNNSSVKRNSVITFVIVTVLVSITALGSHFTRPSKKVALNTQPVDFGAIIGDDFTSADNQSALSAQQATLTSQAALIKTLNGALERMTTKLDHSLDVQDESFKRLKDKMEATFEQQRAELALQANKAVQQSAVNTPVNTPNSTASMSSNQPDMFGDRPLPPKATSSSNNNPNQKDFAYNAADKPLFNVSGIDTINFHWASEEKEKQRRTVDNYVPTGTFVTALVTGGADVNAGVLGQGDTVPMVFQTLNAGVLPNGKPSKLKDCTITGSSYGEISSSRGIVRTNRMSCIFADGGIIDLPVKGTVFNFGRNGIRGTTILRNGKIVQMAGISGILSGIGETGKALSTTTSTSALGATSTINSSDAAMNLLGSATSSVGEKLSNYYIQLAELYHPIVELNPGNVVNIVFLAGFPLEPLEIEKYEKELAAEGAQTQSNQLLEVITNNPLANQLPPGVKAAAGGQQAPFSNFGTH
jgi:conjugal transfer pilus assembly protein TraB